MEEHPIPMFVNSSERSLAPAEWGFTEFYGGPDDAGPRCSVMHIRRGYQLPMVRFVAGASGVARTSTMFCISGDGYIVIPPPDFDPATDGAHMLVPLAVTSQDMLRIAAGVWHRVFAGDSDLVFFVTDYGWRGASVEEMAVPDTLFGPAKEA